MSYKIICLSLILCVVGIRCSSRKKASQNVRKDFLAFYNLVNPLTIEPEEVVLPVWEVKENTKLPAEIFIGEDVYFGGKFSIKSPNAYFLYISYMKSQETWDLYLTYDKNGKQLDYRLIKIFCDPCKKGELFATTQVDRANGVLASIKIEYYTPILTRDMIDLDQRKIIRKDTLLINSNGFFLEN